MSGDWLGPLLLLFGWWLGPERTDKNHPLAPWAGIGSTAYVYVVNEDEDTLRVMAAAPEVDGALRYLGAVPPHGEAAFKLPYVDARVTLYTPIGEFDVKKPGVWSVTWR